MPKTAWVLLGAGRESCPKKSVSQSKTKLVIDNVNEDVEKPAHSQKAILKILIGRSFLDSSYIYMSPIYIQSFRNVPHPLIWQIYF